MTMSQQTAKRWQENYVPRHKQQKKVIVKVKNKSWLTKGEKVLYSLGFILLLVAIFYVVSFSAKVDQLNRNYQSLETEVNAKITSNEVLTYEAKELSEPSRILEIANKNGFTVQGKQIKRIKKSTEN